jgi:hypothetical protein
MQAVERNQGQPKAAEQIQEDYKSDGTGRVPEVHFPSIG